MNKRQELDMMVMASKIRAEKLLQEAALSWMGKEAREMGAPKPYQGDREEPVIMGGQNGDRPAGA